MILVELKINTYIQKATLLTLHYRYIKDCCEINVYIIINMI